MPIEVVPTTGGPDVVPNFLPAPGPAASQSRSNAGAVTGSARTGTGTSVFRHQIKGISRNRTVKHLGECGYT